VPVSLLLITVEDTMPAKKSAATAPPQPVDIDRLRPRILYRLVELMEELPPLGDKYENGLRNLIEQAVRDTSGNPNPSNLTEIVEEVFEKVTNIAPIGPFLHDPVISEVMINGAGQVFIEKEGQLILTDAMYDNEVHLRLAINNLLNPIGRFVNFNHPMADSHLPDGSRVNVVIPPVAQHGSVVSIRKFLKEMLSLEDLLRFGAMNEEIAEFIGVCVRGRLNIIVAGNTSSGKTTLLNILTRSIPDNERIVTIEDSVELFKHTRLPWRQNRPITKAWAKSPSATWCVTPCACGQIASSWAKYAARRHSICSRL
jgi:pilus assembly protein CpaF